MRDQARSPVPAAVCGFTFFCALAAAAVPLGPSASRRAGTPARSAPAIARELFVDDFSNGLGRWDIVGDRAVSILESGDPRHGPVLQLMPDGDALALIRGSDAWPVARVEGEMMFPTAEDNYLGLAYHAARRGARWDFGLVYVKGNDGYLQLNPHRDFNVSRTLYPEVRTPLRGESSVETGRWQRFAFEVAGTAVHVYVGAATTPRLTFTLYERDRGSLGLQPRSVGGPVRVDNIVVRAIDRLSYDGPPVPAVRYTPDQLLTDWQLAGPFDRTDDRIAREPAAFQHWSRFDTDSRGAVVTGRVVDYHGPRSVAYFRAIVASDSAQSAELHLSTVDDVALWVNGMFQGFVPRQDLAWFDLPTNPAHEGRRVPLDLRAGSNDVVLRVRGGVYASGGFFARLVRR